MNRKLKKSRAIEYIVLCYAAVLILLAGPLGIFDGTRQITGNETPAGTSQLIDQDSRIQQVFIADGGYLEKISIYAMEDLSRKVINLTISDELGETVFSRNVALDARQKVFSVCVFSRSRRIPDSTGQGLCMADQPSGEAHKLWLSEYGRVRTGHLRKLLLCRKRSV